MNNLLIEEYPLVIIPSLAEKIGLNEAILLQQIHFWLNKKKHKKEGRYWVYNTYKEWAKQFPFWSESTIRRTVNSLEKQKLLIVGNFNKLKIDNTKWYTIDYEEVNRMNRPSVQNEQTDCSKWTDGTVQNEQTITIDYPETTTETNKYIVEIVEYLNHAANKNYRHTTRKTRSLIKARFNEGFTLDDFKKVIDIKVSEWGRNPKMKKYLRPETLFGTKFESYLNQEGGEQPKDEYDDLF